MNLLARRSFLGGLGLGVLSAPSLSKLFAQAKNAPDRFRIGIQEYTFHRWLKDGKLTHLDYPALCKEKLGIESVEYWSRPFGGKHLDRSYVGELKKRTVGEGIENVLILVDEKNELDHANKDQRDKSVEAHKGWIDCAAQLGCSAIRVNCRSGGRSRGEPQTGGRRARPTLRICGKDSRPSGHRTARTEFSDPDWILSVIRELNHPHAGILPDFNNFGAYDRYDAVRRTLPHAPAVCAKALKFDEEGNETHTDFYRMLEIVYQSDFSGVISIEFEGHGMDPVAGSLKTKELILKGLAKARKA